MIYKIIEIKYVINTGSYHEDVCSCLYVFILDQIIRFDLIHLFLVP